ncbi:MAG: ABC transporter permease [Bacteroidetes bacterium]|nr:ABC transporter permease [Bacteroidota bacterium]
MLKFIIKRLLYGILVLFGVLTVVFLMFNVLPGDPARMQMGQHTDSASVAIIRQDLGLDQPLPKQYLMFLNDISFVSVHHPENRKDSYYLDTVKYGQPLQLFSVGGGRELVLKMPYLRRSYHDRRPVSEIILETLPETIVLAFAAMIIASVFGIALGIVGALNKNTWIDRIIAVFSTLGTAGPSFFYALIISWVFGYLLKEITGLKNAGSLFDPVDESLQLQNLILPAITLGIRPLALITQLTRSSLLEVLSHDYIRTAHAKGLSRTKVIFKHALKNAMNPVVTSISGWLASLMAGAALVEPIFDWKGIGNEVVQALMNYDLPVVMGSTLVFSIMFVILNLLVDISYGFLDPRVRVS